MTPRAGSGRRHRTGGEPPRASNNDGARSRALAALAVDRVLGKGASLDDAFAQVLTDELPGRERSRVRALAYGTLRWHHRHRLMIADLLERPLRSRDRVLEALLSVALHELIEARQPPYASISAAVDASRQLGRQRASGLVNAALRRFQREQDALLSRALAEDEGRYSHPRWLIERLRTDWPRLWGAILAATLAQPPMWLRVNRTRTTREDYAKRLEASTGIATDAPAAYPDALRLARALPVASLPGFEDGDVSVQDAAAQLAAPFLAAEPRMRVLDACAAPGGKTTHLLELAAGDLALVAVDANAARNELVRGNLRRLGCTAEVVTADLREFAASAGGPRFDRILLDAPCSATGVIRRHPDIKFLRRPEDIDAMAERQLEMLHASWQLLVPGGRLLYATCSVLRQENDELVARFLAARPDASEVRLDAPDAADLVGPGLQLLPGTPNTDGFYYALMERGER